MYLKCFVLSFLLNIILGVSSSFIVANNKLLKYQNRVLRNNSEVLWEWAGTSVKFAMQCSSSVTPNILPSSAKCQCRKHLCSYSKMCESQTSAAECERVGPYESRSLSECMWHTVAHRAANYSITYHIQPPITNFIQPMETEKYQFLVNGEVQTTITASMSLGGTYEVPFPVNFTEEFFYYTLELLKITERITVAMEWSLVEKQAATIFRGLEIPDDCYVVGLPPSKAPRQINFVGDSITCGFGNLAKGTIEEIECTVPPKGWSKFEDFSISTAYLMAKAVEAELHTQCISQVGITRNGITLAKTTSYNMTHYINRTLPTLPGHDWDYTANPVPDIAVINLGTNDYDVSSIFHEQPSFEVFEAKYTLFLNQYVSSFGGRLKALVVACGPMTKVQCATVNLCASNIASAWPHMLVRYLEFNLTDAKLTGCITHPNAAGHKTMFDQLLPTVHQLTGW